MASSLSNSFNTITEEVDKINFKKAIIIKNVKRVELNTKIVRVINYGQTLKTI